jgi:hypothetical protein
MDNEYELGQEYGRRKDKIVDDIAREFERNGVKTLPELVGLIIYDLRGKPYLSIQTRGDILEMREWNISEEEKLSIWQCYRHLHNYEAEQMGHLRPLSFDPVNWKHLAEILVEGARRFSKARDEIFVSGNA